MNRPWRVNTAAHFRMLGLTLAIGLNALAAWSDETAAPAPLAAWGDDFAAAQQAAQNQQRPILARVGGAACPWCKRLEESLAHPQVQQELSHWTLVYLDVQAAPDLTRRWSVAGIPALRALTQHGRVIGSHDGYLNWEQLVDWLQQHRETATGRVDASLFSDEPPTTIELLRIVKRFGDRDATIREAAIQRLAPYPKVAGDEVMKAFQTGGLSQKLCAFELLHEWRAPLVGVDPWDARTLTQQRFETLARWLHELPPNPDADAEQPLTEEQTALLRRQIDRLLVAELDEARAIRERIARHGVQARPMVLERLASAESDADRQRLLATRYRLAAPSSLPNQWPGGLERLASNDSAQRQQAAAELAQRATDDTQPLLLELFSDSDPLVRELSLQGLQSAGGQRAISALVQLLQDPEPNVRAAVLKQLAEDADKKLTSHVLEYMEVETDPDLIVHGIRYLKAVGAPEVWPMLFQLLEHESWQVRAEAATTLVEARSSYGQQRLPEPEHPRFKKAMLKLLSDEDAFVAAQAIQGVAKDDSADSIEALAGVAASHPELGALVARTLASGANLAGESEPQLRAFLASELPETRAAAIAGLVAVGSDQFAAEIQTALEDSSVIVRQQGALGVLAALNKSRPSNEPEVAEHNITRPRPTLLDPFAGILDFPTTPSPDVPPSVPSVEDPISEPGAESDATTPADASDPSDATHLPPWEVAPDAGSPGAIDTSVLADSATTDRWLANLATPDRRPDWLAPLLPLLSEMATSDDPLEQLASAMALIAVGDTQHVETVVRLLATHPHLSDPGHQTLTWLPWDRRAALFQRLAPTTSDPESLALALTTVADYRNADLLWQILEIGQLKPTAVVRFQKTVYWGSSYYQEDSLSAPQRTVVTRLLQREGASGNGVKRLAALTVLNFMDASLAGQEAQHLVDNEELDPETRYDALQMYLASFTPLERNKTCTRLLAEEDWQRKLALATLATNGENLQLLKHTELRLQSTGLNSYGSEARAIIPLPPLGLELEAVEPLRQDPDLETAAYAAHMATLFEQPGALPQLLEYWESAPQDSLLDRLVYRSIAILNAGEHVPILREIYPRAKATDVSQFYWTIRIMSGDEILEFRKQIREEVGMDHL